MTRYPSANDVILHQYEISPYSQKVRLLLGVKGLEWFACNQPVTLPKPELLHLTGGYRRIPVMQIGAEIWCGSDLIVEEIARRFPELALAGGFGTLESDAVKIWSDGEVFPVVVRLLFSGDWPVDDIFMADRSAMRGQPFSVTDDESWKPLAARFRAMLGLIEGRLADGRAFLSGDRPGALDVELFHHVAFVKWGRGRTAALLGAFPAILEWENRIRAIGTGSVHPIERAVAIKVARDDILTLEPSGRFVRYLGPEKNAVPIEGALIDIDDKSVTMLRYAKELGSILVHLPTRNCAVEFDDA